MTQLLKQLKTQELKNTAYSCLMAVCGVILGVLAIITIVPVLIPLFIPSSRDYIGSFFKAPKASADACKTTMDESMAGLEEVFSEQENIASPDCCA